MADFIGESNTVGVQIEHVDGNAGIATVQLGDMVLQLPSRGLPVGPAHLAVRPNRIVLSPRPAGAASDPHLAGTVTKATYVGNHMEYRVSTDFGDWFATSDNIDEVLADNDSVAVSFASRGPVLLPA